MNELLSQLKRPFEPKHLSWKPGATKGDRCLALAYADLRAYMERLDEVCGLDWSVAYEPWHENRIICRLTISGVTRSSTGEMDSREEKSEIGGTSAEAQSFKRACAMFGLGRFLYDLPAAWVAFDAQAKRITDAGQKELDGRYIMWYNKTVAALVKEQSKAPRQVDASTGEIVDSLPVATDVIFQAEEPPTDEEHDIITIWQSSQDAYVWSVNVGACGNIHEAENSMRKVVREKGLKFTAENKLPIFLAFLRHQNMKLAQQPEAA